MHPGMHPKTSARDRAHAYLALAYMSNTFDIRKVYETAAWISNLFDIHAESPPTAFLFPAPLRVIRERRRSPGVRSQAHETLGAMTTIIMRTSDDNRMWSFLAFFQGFPFLGNLPITLVFHEAPTGTRK